MGVYQHVLVAVEGSSHANEAVGVAAKLAGTVGAKVTFVHVLPHSGSARVPTALEEYARIEHLDASNANVLESVADEILIRAVDLARRSGLDAADRVVLTGDTASEVTKWAKSHDVDLIVVGRRGLGRLRELILGSVSNKVVHDAPCPCLTV